MRARDVRLILALVLAGLAWVRFVERPTARTLVAAIVDTLAIPS